MSRFLLLTNGPGELWGWARPLVTALTARGHEIDIQLLPCPFATGRESLVARHLPARVLPPGPLPSLYRFLDRSEADMVVQLGGDLLFGRLASRRGAPPLVAYAYGPKPGLSRCEAVFTAFDAMTAPLKGRADVIGDLVASAVELDGAAPVWERGESPRLVFYPGSRPAIRKIALPFLEEVASCLRKVYPRLGLRTLLSPFADETEYPLWEKAGLFPTFSGAGAVLRGADFALTQPGTNTLELLHRAVPGLVAVPFAFLRQIPLAGVKKWLASIPLLGKWGKEGYLRAMASKGRFLAWPNIIAGRELLQERVGELGPRDLADSVVKALDDGRELAERRKGLLALADDGEASNRLAFALEEMILSR